NSVNRLIKLSKAGFSGIKVGGNSIDSDSVLKALANIHKNGIETNNPPIASNNAAKNFSVFFLFVCEAISFNPINYSSSVFLNLNCINVTTIIIINNTTDAAAAYPNSFD